MLSYVGDLNLHSGLCLGAQQQPAGRAGGRGFAVEQGVDGHCSNSWTAPGDNHAGSQLRDHACGDV